MKIWLTLSMIICVCSVKGQENYALTDAKALAIPAALTVNTSSIADYIQSHFNTDLEKYRAIYTWVASSIKYDTDSMYIINWSQGGEAKITEALRRRKGVCENFAAIFTDIANKCGLVSFVIEGYTKQNGRLDKSGHSWCAVKLKDKWLLCDPTWDKDSPVKTSYFLVNPADLITTHMPFDPMWQLLEYPLDHYEFYRGWLTPRQAHNPFNYADSIKAYSRQGELQRLESSAIRMNYSGKLNEMMTNRIAYTNMKIAIIYEEIDMNLYNDAVADFNKAMESFNEFIKHRNNQFLPPRPQTEINQLLQTADDAITTALIKTKEIGKVVENYQYDPSVLINRLNALSLRVDEQKEYLINYFLVQEKKNYKE